ncbi:MAG: cytochrome c oxidase assembly protein [Candidatus Rokubacteria bacterium]|nr:cytochrome c oxidase assembly protein [Candidatus Rokubacteria bacterium]
MSLGLEPELLHWHGRPDVSLVLLTLGSLYAVGWWRLRRLGHRRLASAGRLAAYLGGLAAVAVALLSPLERLADLLFTAHMVQHQILLMVAPPCLLLGNPFPFVLWGVPRRLRRAVQRALTEGSRLRRTQRLLTWLPVAGPLYTGNLWLWHLPAAYEAALRHPLVHDVEHLAFFTAAVLFWWPIVNPAPRRRWPRGGLYYGVRIAYLVLATAQNTLLGAIIALTERVLYPSYGAGSGLFGLSPLDDQAFGGGIMWSGGHMYLIAILILLWQAMGSDGREAATPAAKVPLRRDRVEW